MRRIEGAPEPAGFGNCAECAYKMQGTPAICFACAQRVVVPLPVPRCHHCDGALRDGVCANSICALSPERRGWRHVYAIAQRRGELERAITRYKYRDKVGWAWIFGRLVVGSLQQQFETPRVEHHLIVPMPTYVGVDGRSWDHTGEVLKQAEIEDDRWPFEFDVVRKLGHTPSMMGASRIERQFIAREQLAPLIQVERPTLVRGKRVLVYDDVFTTGATLSVVARKLVEAGARAVDSLVLARQPLRP
jgi:predicted amidophosphoribosyltransferase